MFRLLRLILAFLGLLTVVSCVNWADVRPEIYILNSSIDLSEDIVIYYDRSVDGNNDFDSVTHISYCSPGFSPGSGIFVGFNSFSRSLHYYKKEEVGNMAYVYFHLKNQNIATGEIRVHVDDYCQEIKLKNNRVLKVSYPTFLTVSHLSVGVGDKITITSTKPFFNLETFTDDNMAYKFDNLYDMIWVSSSENYYNNYDSYEDISHNFPRNFEKVPVPIEYYDLNSITPYSISFTVPDFMRTGTIHVLNEDGLGLLNSPYEASFAFYTTKEKVIVK